MRSTCNRAALGRCCVRTDRTEARSLVDFQRVRIGNPLRRPAEQELNSCGAAIAVTKETHADTVAGHHVPWVARGR